MILIVSEHQKNSAMTTSRNSHQSCSLRKGVLRNFVKFTGKHPCRSLFFNKVVEKELFKKRLWRMCFPVNFAKFLRTPFLADYLLWLLLQPATLLKKRFPQKCFFCEFGGTLLVDCFLSLSVNFEKFFRTSVL